MKLVRNRLLLTLLVVGLSACNSWPGKMAPEAAKPELSSSGSAGLDSEGATSGQETPESGLSPEIVFNVLAGELASQRGRFETAYQHQMKAAELTQDAKSAERATRLAIHLKSDEKAILAVERWISLAPEELAAHQLAAVLYLKRGDRQVALQHLKSILSLSEEKGENGYLHAIAAVNRESDKALAIDLMRELAALHPEDPRSRNAVAMTALMAKDFEVARQEARKLIDSHPDWPEAYLIMSRVFVAQGEKAEARQLLTEATDRLPEEPRLLAALARLLIDAKEMSRAYDLFVKVRDITPEDSNTTYWLGILALDLERKEVARTHFMELISKGERTEVASFYLGRIEESESNDTEALEWYRKVDQGEFRYEAQVRTAYLLGRQGALKEARNRLQMMRIQMPKQSVQLFLVEADLLQEHGKPDQVMALFSKSLKAHPDNEDLLYARALFAVTQNRIDILERDLKTVIENNPRHADALNALGYTLADQTDRLTEAFDYISQALELKPDAPAILDSMGWVLFRMGDYQEALKYLRQAFNLLPDSEIAAHYGEVLWVTGDQETAGKVWQGILDSDPESEHVLRVMRRLKQ